MHKKILLIIGILLSISTVTSAYMVTDTQKYDGYSESKITCPNGRETFVHKTLQGYYSSKYERYETFKSAATSSCKEKEHIQKLKEKIKYLKHNAKICQTADGMERLLSNVKAYYHSISHACFLAMNGDKVKLISYFDNKTLIDRYYKVKYQDKNYYVREDDIKFNKKVNIALPYITPISKLKNKSEKTIKKKSVINKKIITKKQKLLKKKYKLSKKKIERKTLLKNKKKHKKKIQKAKRKIVMYYCRAISDSARGWSTKSSIYKAKKYALHECTIRNKTPKPCWIEKCSKK